MKRLAWMVVAAMMVSGCSKDGASTTTADTASGAPTGPSGDPGASATAQASATGQDRADTPAPSGDVPESVEGANVTMGESEVDGLKSKSVSCKSSAGVFASMAILGALAKKKDELVQCGAKEPRIHFTFEAGKTKVEAVAGGESEQLRCVAGVVAATVLPDAGSCVMTLLLAP